MIPLPAYYEKLTKFDWDFERSDDNGVWKRCQSEYDQLRILAVTDEHRTLLKGFEDHHGARNRKADGWDCEIPELPARPVEAVAA